MSRDDERYLLYLTILEFEADVDGDSIELDVGCATGPVRLNLSLLDFEDDFDDDSIEFNVDRVTGAV